MDGSPLQSGPPTTGRDFFPGLGPRTTDVFDYNSLGNSGKQYLCGGNFYPPKMAAAVTNFILNWRKNTLSRSPCT